MADGSGNPGSLSSLLYADHFLEQSYDESDDTTRKLATPNEAIMVMEMIENDLAEVYLKQKTIDDNVKRLKRYIEEDTRRKSCGIMDIENEFCREAIHIARVEVPGGLSEETLVCVLKEFRNGRKQQVIARYASGNLKKFRSQLLLIERHLMKGRKIKTSNVPASVTKKIRIILDTVEEMIENTGIVDSDNESCHDAFSDGIYDSEEVMVRVAKMYETEYNPRKWRKSKSQRLHSKHEPAKRRQKNTSNAPDSVTMKERKKSFLKLSKN